MSTPARRSRHTPRIAGLVALLVCVLLVGVIRSAIPDGPPEEDRVLPDEHGVVRTNEVTVELISVMTASSVRPVGEFGDALFVASPGTVLVLGRFSLTAHGAPYFVSTQLRTSDGYSYAALSLPDFPQPGIHVGFSVTTTFIYEVPLDKLEGVIGIHGPRDDGLQPVHPLIAYALPEDLSRQPGEVQIPQAETEPVR